MVTVTQVTHGVGNTVLKNSGTESVLTPQVTTGADKPGDNPRAQGGLIALWLFKPPMESRDFLRRLGPSTSECIKIRAKKSSKGRACC